MSRLKNAYPRRRRNTCSLIIQRNRLSRYRAANRYRGSNAQHLCASQAQLLWIHKRGGQVLWSCNFYCFPFEIRNPFDGHFGSAKHRSLKTLQRALLLPQRLVRKRHAARGQTLVVNYHNWQLAEQLLISTRERAPHSQLVRRPQWRRADAIRTSPKNACRRSNWWRTPYHYEVSFWKRI